MVGVGMVVWVAEPKPEGLCPWWLTFWRVDGEESWKWPDQRWWAVAREG